MGHAASGRRRSRRRSSRIDALEADLRAGTGTRCRVFGDAMAAEVQRLRLDASGAALSGSFRVAFRDEWTGALTTSAAAANGGAALRSALRGLTTVRDVEVSGAALDDAVELGALLREALGRVDHERHPRADGVRLRLGDHSRRVLERRALRR